MSQKVKYGNRTIEREQFSRAKELFQSPDLLAMIDRQLALAEKHAEDYPLLDKERTVTIKLSLKPLAKIKDGELDYKKALFTAKVASPTLPETSIPFACAVSNGKAFFNVEDPENPLQLTFRDQDMCGDEEAVADGQSLAAGN